MYLRTFSEVQGVLLKRSSLSNKFTPSDSEDDYTDDNSELMKPTFGNSTTAEPIDISSKSYKIQKVEVIDDAGPSTSGATILKPSSSRMPSNHALEYQARVDGRYNNYLEILIGDSDEDIEMTAAIQASFEDQANSIQESKEPSEIIKEYVNKNLDTTNDDYVNIIINRKNVLSSTLKAIARKAFSFNREVHVTFSGENGVDSGGPRREYFRLLMLSLKTLGIFQGNWFSHDLQLLHSRKYELAGKLIAWSILQGGPGLKHLSQDAYCVMNDLPWQSRLLVILRCKVFYQNWRIAPMMKCLMLLKNQMLI